MKKLNIPFLLFLVIGFMVLVVGTHFLHGYQLARNAANLRERADRGTGQELKQTAYEAPTRGELTSTHWRASTVCL